MASVVHSRFHKPAALRVIPPVLAAPDCFCRRVHRSSSGWPGVTIFSRFWKIDSGNLFHILEDTGNGTIATRKSATQQLSNSATQQLSNSANQQISKSANQQIRSGS
jgi:hypothetical protein